MNQIQIQGTAPVLVRDIGFTLASSGWIHPDRVLDYHVMIFVLRGQMQVIEEHTEYILSAGDILFLKKGLHHWGTKAAAPDTETLWVHFFDPCHISSGMEEYRPFPETLMYTPKSYAFFFTLPKSLHLKNPSMACRTLRNLHSLFLSGQLLCQYTLSLKYTEFLAELYMQTRHPDKDKHESPLLSQILQYLEEHCKSPLDTTDLSKRLGKNYHYLSTLFKQQTGFSISEYHQRLRINQAAVLLKDMRRNISEISKLVGYSDPLYFSRVFKKMTGECPTEFRKGCYEGGNIFED